MGELAAAAAMGDMRISLGKLALALGGSTLFAAMLGALFFLAAGRWDLPWFWAYVALYAVFCFLALLLLDPGLLKERFRPGSNARDVTTVSIAKIMASAHYVVAALDVGRFQWSGNIPAALQATAFAIAALSAAAMVWAMVVNPFFATVVRIQEERGHRVITKGPYRIVRHPGYVVASLLLLGGGVALGSWWSLVPAGVLVVAFIRRTALEDRFLHEHLEGYAEYARQVRYCLIPGVW